MFSEPDSSTIKSTFLQYEEGCNGCKVEEVLDSKKEASLCNTWRGTDDMNNCPTDAPTMIKNKVNNVITKMSWEESKELKS